MEENLNIFGKNLEEIGSLDKNLVLRTKGRVYIRYGRKYIELLDDKGNINVKIPKILIEVDSIDKIKNTGFYFFDKNLYVCYEGDIFQITGTNGQYISYNVDLLLTQELINITQKNVGLTFSSITEATNSIKKGIVFIEDKIYYIKEDSAKEIFELNNPLKEINSAELDETPSSNNSVLLWKNGNWVYEEVVLKKDLENSSANLNTPLKEINESKLGNPEEFITYKEDLIPKAIVSTKNEDNIIKWNYENIVLFSSFKNFCEYVEEQIELLKEKIEKAKNLSDSEFGYPVSSFTVTLEGTTLPVLTNIYNVPTTYNSNNQNVATINSSTGIVTIKNNGNTNIKATFNGNDKFNEKTSLYTLIVNILSDLNSFLNVYNTEFFNTYNEPITSSSGNYLFLTEAFDYFEEQYSTINWENILKDPELEFNSLYEITSISKESCFGWFLAYLLLSLYPLRGIDGNKVTNDEILKVAFENYSEVYKGCNYAEVDLNNYLEKYGSAIFASIIFSRMISDSNMRTKFKTLKNTTYSTKFVLSYNYKKGTDPNESLRDATSLDYYLVASGNYWTSTMVLTNNLWPDGSVFFPNRPVNGSNDPIYNRDKYAHDLAGKYRGNSTNRGLVAYEDIILTSDVTGYLVEKYNLVTGRSIVKNTRSYQILDRTCRSGSKTVNTIKTDANLFRVRPLNFLSTEVDGGTTYPYGAYNNGTYYYDNVTKEGVSGTTSYPSGHTGKGWHFALVYSAISPNLSTTNIENLFKRAFKFCESRVVVGAHWQYCVDMGRIAAACVFPVICGNNDFIDVLDEAT